MEQQYKEVDIGRACVFAFIIWLTLIIIAVSGCAGYHQRQEDRKDQRALERVLGKDALTAKVVQRNGGAGVEEKTVVTPRTDSGSAPHTNPAPIDSSCEELHRYVNSLVFATDTPLTYKFGRGIYVSIGGHGVSAWSTYADTIRTIKDNREGLRWRDSTDAERKRSIALSEQLRLAQLQIDQLKADTLAKGKKISQLEAPPKKKGIKWYWWIIGIVALAVVLVVLAARKVLPWMAIVKAFTYIIQAFRKKPQSYSAPAFIPSKPGENRVDIANGYYRLFPYKDGYQWQRVADNNRAIATSQKYDDRSSALAAILADRGLTNMPIKEAKGPLPA